MWLSHPHTCPTSSWATPIPCDQGWQFLTFRYIPLARVSDSYGPHDSNGPPIWRPLKPQHSTSSILTNLRDFGPWFFTYRKNEKYKSVQSKKEEKNRSCVPTIPLDKNPQWGPLLSILEDRYCHSNFSSEDRYCQKITKEGGPLLSLEDRYLTYLL